MLKMVVRSFNFVIWFDFEDLGQLKNVLLLEKQGYKGSCFYFSCFEVKND
jgi:hypothetical protein